MITKDRDFVELLGRLGPPPKIIWITCGNTSNTRQAQAMGHDRARWGSVTFVQRFGSSLNLNPHMHVLMIDGSTSMGRTLRFSYRPRRCPNVQQIVQTSAYRILCLCTRHGLFDDIQADPLADEDPVLAALMAASVRGIIA